MTPEVTRVRLPHSLDEGELRSVLDSVFFYFGADLGKKAAAPFTRIYGDDWERELAKERANRTGTDRGRPFNGSDPSAVLAALLDNSTVLKEVASKDPKLQGNLENRIRKTLKLRHSFYHFEWQDYGTKRVRDALDGILDCAGKLALKVTADIDAALDRISRIESGQEVAPPTSADLKELRRQQRESDRLAAQFQEERDLALKEARVWEELAIEKDAERNALANSAQDDRDRLASAAKNALASKEQAEKRASTAEARHAAALTQVHELTGSVKTLEDRLALAESAAGRPPNDRANPLPVPGQPWPFVRGVRQVTLSTAAGDVVDEHRGTLNVPDLAQRWLTIRPTGGRVWVDEDGDACTLHEGDLIYLGRLPAPASKGPMPRAGDIVDLPPREGRRLTLHLDGNITDRAGGDRRLAGVIPKSAAIETGQALLRHFPDAGVIYQRSDGLLTRDLPGGGCKVLGHVRDVAWFPDLLASKG